MSMHFSFDHDRGEVDDRSGPRPGADEAFRIGLIGDFSGRSTRGVVESSESIAARGPMRVDIDTLEEVLARLNVQIRVPVGQGGEIVINVGEIDDFHPDALAAKLDLFRELRRTRKRLADPGTFAEAAREVQSWASESTAPEPSASPAPSAPSAPEEPTAAPADNPFASLLGGPASTGREGSGVDISALLRQVVGPHVVPAADPRQEALIASVDQAMGEQMRAILHDPGFQRVESAWRGAHLLITSLELDEDLRLDLIDVCPEEVSSDLSAHEDVTQTGLYRLIVERGAGSPGATPWALLVWMHALGPTRQEAGVAARLGAVGAGAGAPVLAGASAALAGCDSFADAPSPESWHVEGNDEERAAWDLLRASPAARWISLSAPRFLLRQPFGPGSDPIDAFEFDELPGTGGDHERYLWCTGSVACCVLLGQMFTEHGWAIPAAAAGDVGGLPVHSWREGGGGGKGGESRMKACAEGWLTDRSGQALLDRGITPLLSIQGRDAVRIVQIVSLDGRTVRGRWS